MTVARIDSPHAPMGNGATMERDNFFEPLDPNYQIPPEFPDSASPDRYRQYALGTHTQTDNASVAQLYQYIGTRGQQVSIRGHVDQQLVLRDVIETSLNAINEAIAQARLLTVSGANEMFDYDWGGVNGWNLGSIPVRFPSENMWSLKCGLSFGAAVYALVRVPSNRVSRGLTTVSASSVVKPLIGYKRDVMQQLFRIEVRGIARPEEIAALFAQFNPIVPIGAGELTPEQAAGDQSAERPSDEQATGILSGADIFSWVPTEADWQLFDRITSSMELVGASASPDYSVVQGSGTPNGTA